MSDLLARFIDDGEEDPIDPRFIDDSPAPDVYAVPNSTGAKFSAGANSAMQGMQGDFEYFKAIGNILIGDEDAAAENVEAAELRQELAAMPMRGMETFAEFIDQPTFDGFYDQLVSSVGMITPSLLSSVATGLSGAVAGVVGKAVLSTGGKKAAKKLLQDSLERKARNEVLTRQETEALDAAYGVLQKSINYKGAAKVGGIAGLAASEFPLMAGGSLAEFDEAGEDLTSERALQSLLIGSAQTAVSVGGEAFVMTKLKDLALSKATKESGLLASMGKGAVKGFGFSAATEGTTEVIQEGMNVAQRFAVDEDYTKEEAQLRLGQSFFVGALGSGVFGGAGGGAAGVFSKARSMLSQSSENNQNAQMDAEATGATEETVFGGTPTPESPNDINAQFAASNNPNSSKRIMWTPNPNDVSQTGDIETYQDENGEDIYALVVDGQGRAFSKDRAALEELLNAEDHETTLASLLGYSGVKPEDGDRVVRITDAEGNVISEEATNAAGEAAALQAAERIRTSPNDVIDVISNKTALEDRAQRLKKTLNIKKMQSDLDEDVDPTESETPTELQELDGFVEQDTNIDVDLTEGGYAPQSLLYLSKETPKVTAEREDFLQRIEDISNSPDNGTTFEAYDGYEQDLTHGAAKKLAQTMSEVPGDYFVEAEVVNGERRIFLRRGGSFNDLENGQLEWEMVQSTFRDRKDSTANQNYFTIDAEGETDSQKKRNTKIDIPVFQAINEETGEVYSVKVNDLVTAGRTFNVQTDTALVGEGMDTTQSLKAGLLSGMKALEARGFRLNYFGRPLDNEYIQQLRTAQPNQDGGTAQEVRFFNELILLTQNGARFTLADIVGAPDSIPLESRNASDPVGRAQKAAKKIEDALRKNPNRSETEIALMMPAIEAGLIEEALAEEKARGPVTGVETLEKAPGSFVNKRGESTLPDARDPEALDRARQLRSDPAAVTEEAKARVKARLVERYEAAVLQMMGLGRKDSATLQNRSKALTELDRRNVKKITDIINQTLREDSKFSRLSEKGQKAQKEALISEAIEQYLQDRPSELDYRGTGPLPLGSSSIGVADTDQEAWAQITGAARTNSLVDVERKKILEEINILLGDDLKDPLTKFAPENTNEADLQTSDKLDLTITTDMGVDLLAADTVSEPAVSEAVSDPREVNLPSDPASQKRADKLTGRSKPKSPEYAFVDRYDEIAMAAFEAAKDAGVFDDAKETLGTNPTSTTERIPSRILIESAPQAGGLSQAQQNRLGYDNTGKILSKEQMETKEALRFDSPLNSASQYMTSVYGDFGDAANAIIALALKVFQGLRNQRITIFTLSELQKNFDNTLEADSPLLMIARSQLQEMLTEFENNPTTQGLNASNGSETFIVIREQTTENGDVSDVLTAAILGHELGHSIFGKALTELEANPTTHKRLIDAFTAAINGPLKDVEQYKGIDGFEEWYSDQVAAFLLNKKKTAKNGADSYFKRLAQKIRAFISRVNTMLGGRLTADKEFTAYVNAMLKAEKKALQFERGSIKKGDHIDGYVLKRMVSAVRETVPQRIARQYNKYAEKILASGAMGLFNKYALANDNWLRSLGPEGTMIAQFFSAQSNSNEKNGFHHDKQRIENIYIQKLAKVLGVDPSKADEWVNNPELDEIFRNVEDDTIDTADLKPKERAVRELYTTFYQEYLLDGEGRPLSQTMFRKNYAPRQINFAALDQSTEAQEKLARAMVDHPRPGEPEITLSTARRLVRTIMLNSTENPDVVSDETEDTTDNITPGFNNAASRTLGAIPTKVLRDIGVLTPAAEAAVQYFHHAIRKKEYERRGGSKYLRGLISSLPEEHQAYAEQAVMAQMGRLGIGMKPWMRTVNSAAAVATATTTLLFTTFSSITDLAGVAIRSKEMGGLSYFFSELNKTLSTKENRELAQAIGVSSSEARDNLFMSFGELDFANAKARKILDYWFKYTGLQWYTRFSREFAAGMGREFLLNTAKAEVTDKTTRYLTELGLTREEVIRWDEGNGSFDTPEGRKVAAAIARFVDESIVRPNPSERPIWASNPYLAVVWQLKSYFYSFGKVMIGGIGREVKNRYREDGNFAGGGQLALLAGATLLPLAAAGMELKELAKYMLQAVIPGIDANDRTFRTNHMRTPEYLATLVDKTGLYGPFTIPISALSSWGWGDNPLVSQIPIVDLFDSTLVEGQWDRPIPVLNNLIAGKSN
jgi:hypothetical protein